MLKYLNFSAIIISASDGGHKKWILKVQKTELKNSETL